MDWHFKTHSDLQVFNILETAIWIFDVDRHEIWWGNSGALNFWKSPSLEALIDRDFSSDSETVRKRLRNIIEMTEQGQSVADSWTIYANEQPVTVPLKMTPIRIAEEGRDAILIEAGSLDQPDLSGDDRRLIEATRYTGIKISYFAMSGELVTSNLAALESYSGRGPEQQSLNHRFVDETLGQTLLHRCQKGAEVSGEFLVNTNAGPKWHKIRITKGRDPVSGGWTLIAIEEDVTALKEAAIGLEDMNLRLEEEIKARTKDYRMASQEADAANRAKSEFLARMSHDLRTPLNAILGFAGILSDANMSGLAAQKYGEYGGLIENAARELLKLVNDLLDLSAIEAGKFPVDPDHIHMQDLIMRTIDMLGQRIYEKDVRMDVDVNCKEMLFTDERCMGLITVNLLSNAVKYNKAGGFVKVQAMDHGDHFEMRVSDNGIGIEDEDLGHIFEPYNRGAADIARDVEGTGLGLAICKRLATLIGGDLTLQSEKGQGTVAHLILPKNEAAQHHFTSLL